MGGADIENLLREDRVFHPSEAFVRDARCNSLDAYRAMYEESVTDPDTFWARVAGELEWFEPWDAVLEWNQPYAKWFVNGKTNISYNCLDRHLSGPRADKVAFIWEGEPGDQRTLTYRELHAEVCKFANVLKARGIGKGDRVCLYMPMILELPIAMLACARIGAPHSIVFGGFSANALVDRINDAEAKAVVTADGGWRRGAVVPLKAAVDEALEHTPTVETVIVYRRTDSEVTMRAGRDHWWHELMADASPECDAEPMDSEDMLYILYTSGTTGKPKGIVHTTGGYMVGTYLTSRYVFDLKDEDIYWCTADIGWVTGHSYIVYGPLANGATGVMYEGAPNHPAPDRLWDIVERHRVTIFYTAPTAIRAFTKWGDDHPKGHDLSSLRLLGTVGEPINPEAWMWYHEVIGGGRCPIVDTWWQTETGAIMLTPLPGAIPTKPGSATLPFFGVVPDVVDKAGNSVEPPKGGFLVIRRPWPSMLRTIYRDDERYRAQYWSEIPGVYFAGDGAHRDADGYYWIMGRVDDVLNVSGHRMGTAEVESALVSHAAVAEAAVVGFPHEIKGEGIAAFVTLKGDTGPSDDTKKALSAHVVKEIGAIARPDQIRFTDALPKTRSGKIMRRLLRDIAAGRTEVGDTTTLEDYHVLAKLRESDEG
ncbi:MAG TPA: acetate--CoA ligase [Acidimicrobiia bacterium]|nr:acetate--CoA ligase [Acidimicrobiia bacterium]